MTHSASLDAARCVVLLLAGAACAAATVPAAPTGHTDADRRTVNACSGPATSLPAALAATLPAPPDPTDPRVVLNVDDRWAIVSRRVPGGFAGVLYDGAQPVLLLTDPSQAAGARAALASELPGFPVAAAKVRRARWSFAQLYDWSRYVWRQPSANFAGGATSLDRDEAANRVYIGARDAAGRDRIVAAVAALDLPCDLVVVGVSGTVVSF